MRTEEEIKRAIQHMDDVMQIATEEEQQAVYLVRDVLRWVIERPSEFGVLKNLCDKFDSARDN